MVFLRKLHHSCVILCRSVQASALLPPLWLRTISKSSSPHALFLPYVCGLKLLDTLDFIIDLPSSFIRAWDRKLQICNKTKLKLKKRIFFLQKPEKSRQRIRKPSYQNKKALVVKFDKKNIGGIWRIFNIVRSKKFEGFGHVNR